MSLVIHTKEPTQPTEPGKQHFNFTTLAGARSRFRTPVPFRVARPRPGIDTHTSGHTPIEADETHRTWQATLLPRAPELWYRMFWPRDVYPDIPVVFWQWIYSWGLDSLLGDIRYSVLDDAGVLHVHCLDDLFVVYTSTTQMWTAVEKAMHLVSPGEVGATPRFD